MYHHFGYAVSGYPQISMHRFILRVKRGEDVDHKNGDKLDNRKLNLRIATGSQNTHNSLCNDGVHWRGDRRAWIVRIKIEGISKYVGYFKTKIEAIKARKKAALIHYKEFSPYARST